LLSDLGVEIGNETGFSSRQWLWLRLGVNIDDRYVYAYILSLTINLTLTDAMHQLLSQTLLPNLLIRTLCAPGTMYAKLDKVFNNTAVIACLID